MPRTKPTTYLFYCHKKAEPSVGPPVRPPAKREAGPSVGPPVF